MADSSVQAFTCISCRVQFKSRDSQREHHQSEWHRYNLKRKVAELAPISLDEFARRAAQLPPDNGKGADKSPSKTKETEKYHCESCAKDFASENTLKNHLNSKKHKLSANKVNEPNEESADAYEKNENVSIVKEDTRFAKAIRKRLNEAQNEQEVLELLEEKVRRAPTLDPKSDCLFCVRKSESLEDNVNHMTKDHSFFIPDIEYLIDLEGLLAYIGEKITKKNWCIYCNDVGKSFQSLEAVRKHMLDKGHQKLNMDDDGDYEYADFYDFSSMDVAEDGEWEDVEGAVDEDTVGDLIIVDHAKTNKLAYVAEDDSSIVLPSGKSIIHRSLVRYYKQRLSPSKESEGEVIAKLAEKYYTLGWLKTPEGKATKTDQRKQYATESDYNMRLGIKANKLQHFFRRRDL